MENDWHQCHFCGTWVQDGKESDGSRHWLSDCRPDLVTHEIGPICTWSYKDDCYAYQIFETGEWTKEHTHFHVDGPM